MKITGGTLVARTLKRFGIRQLFSLPGHQTLSIFDACLDEGITLISTRHEAAAVHMAEGLSFAGRGPGVALLAGGPELTNALTGLAKAFYADTPLVVISGANTPQKLDQGFPQDMNQLELVRPFCKWYRVCHDASRIPEYLAMAFRHALQGSPGPVYLEIPYGVLEQEVAEGGVFFREQPERLRVRPEESALEAARQLLKLAERPLAIAGTGVLWSGAEAELRAFIEGSGIPLMVTPEALALQLPAELVAGLGSPAGGRASLHALAEADVLLLIGMGVDFQLGFGREPFLSASQKIVQLSADPTQIGDNRRVDAGLAGDVKATLEALNQGLMPLASLDGWKARLHQEREAFEGELAPLAASDTVPMHPLRLVTEIERAREPDSVVVLDGANSVLWALLGLRSRPTGRVVIAPSGRLQAIGAGIPQALALKLAHPEQQVILHVGDGSFGYYAMEFETAVRNRIPLIAVVHNDGGWGMTRDMQLEFFGQEREIGNQLGVVRYDRLVEALGGYGELVEQPGELAAAIARAQASGLPACLNVVVDPQPKSPGLMMFMLMEVMLGKQTFYDRIPEVMRRLEGWGLEGPALKLLRRVLEGRLHRNMT